MRGGPILLLAVLVAAPALADDTPAHVVYLGLSAGSPTDFPENATFRVSDASHVLLLEASAGGSGALQLRLRDAEGDVALSRSMEAPIRRSELLRLPVGEHRIEFDPDDFAGDAEANLFDATLAGWLVDPQSLVYEGATFDGPTFTTVVKPFVVPSGGRPLDLYYGATGEGLVEWRILDAEGGTVREASVEGTLARQDELWEPPAGRYVFEVQVLGYQGTIDSGVVDGGDPPFPDPYAAIPLLGTAAPAPGALARAWPFVAGAIGLAAVVGAAAFVRRGPPRRPRSSSPSPSFEQKYRIERELGSGAFGTTYLARHLGLERHVVIKRLRADRVAGVDDLLREAKTLAAVDHPAVTRVFDVERDAQGPYIVMEYVDGGTLEERISRGAFDRAGALAIVDDLLAALEAVHARGVVHGDIKPSNILLTKEGRAKLADFGIARRVGAAELGSTMVTPSSTGTPLYMAPEQVQGLPPTPSSDLYAVAIVAHRLLAGRYYLQPEPSLESELRLAILGRAPTIDGVDPGLRAWLARALAKDPAQRWPDAGAMRAALRGP